MENTSYSGHLVLLMAPSGSGKKHLVDSILANHRDVYFAKTLTSRAIRPGTEENPLYSFISKDEFESMIKEGEFVEWAEFSGSYYGTPRSEIFTPLASGKVVFKEMELQGVNQIKALIPPSNLTVVYVDGGPWEDLKERIVSRAPINDEELEGRKQRYEEEIQSQPAADITIKNHNGELEKAIAEMDMLMRGIIERTRI